MKTYESADYHEFAACFGEVSNPVYFDDSVYPQLSDTLLSDYEHWKHELSFVHTSMDFWLNEYEYEGGEREFQLGMWYEYRDHAIKQMKLANERRV
jgi:hypothetical protein